MLLDSTQLGDLKGKQDYFWPLCSRAREMRSQFSQFSLSSKEFDNDQGEHLKEVYQKSKEGETLAEEANGSGFAMEVAI